MKKLFYTQRSFLKTCWNWLVNIKNLGFLGLIIALFSLIVGYWSFDATYKALKISAKTSFRDSITSIQMNSNRKNDSILTKYNNLRDSIQQQKTVELLEKYNELADKLLKAQVDAEKPSIAIGTALFTDTIYKKLIPFDGHFYRMSINTFEYQNNGKRAAFNLKAKYQLFYPITKQKYTAGDYKTLSEVLLGTKNTYYFHPIIPIEDEKFYFAILTISWEDHLLGIRKDSTNLFMVLGKNSKNIIVKMQMDEERFKIMRNIEKVGKPINFPKEESEYIINEYFPSFYYK